MNYKLSISGFILLLIVFSGSLTSVNGVTLLLTLIAFFCVLFVSQINVQKVQLNFKVLILLNSLIVISDFFSSYQTSFAAKALTLLYLNLPFIFYIIFDNLLSQNLKKIIANLHLCTKFMLSLALLSIGYGYIFGFNYADVTSIFSVLRYVSVGFENQVVFILTLVVSHIIASFLYCHKPTSAKLILLSFMTIFVFMTFSRFAILMVLINIYFIITITFSRMKRIFIQFAFLLSIPALFLGLGLFERFLDLGAYFTEQAQTDVARTLFFVNSLNLALSNFPFGSGLGSFGGVAAKVFYSPVYYEMGFNNIYGLEPDAHLLGRDYRVDTLMPHYLGELGFFVSAIYLLVFFLPFYRIFKLSKKNGMKDIQYFVSSLAIFTVGSMLSTPYIINPVGICITMWLLVCFKKLLLGSKQISTQSINDH